jgi:intracellular multiplication protein IcmJ
MLSLSLGVRRASDAKGLPSLAGAKLQAHHKKVLEKDNYTCRSCGFRSTQYQRVVPVEGEWVTLCSFCEQTLSLDVTGTTGSGTLIWLPEIAQPDLNHLARAIYVARASSNAALAATATRALETLQARRADVKKRLGSDDPLLLATVFFESLDEDEYRARKTKLEGVRLLPLEKRVIATPKGDVDMFPQMMKFWLSKEGPFGQLPVEKWQQMFGEVAALSA